MGLNYLFKSNFVRVAENTTKYYIELKNVYNDKFNDEASLLATAGVLDSQNYVLRDLSINIDTIIELAKKAVSSKELTIYRKLLIQEASANKALINLLTEGSNLEQYPLFNFVFDLEVLLFIIDNPQFSRSDIELACFKKVNAISDAIRKTEKKYRSEAQVALVTKMFIESPELLLYRNQLGIKSSTSYF